MSTQVKYAQEQALIHAFFPRWKGKVSFKQGHTMPHSVFIWLLFSLFWLLMSSTLSRASLIDVTKEFLVRQERLLIPSLSFNLHKGQVFVLLFLLYGT